MINPVFVKHQIENLKITHPEIWEDSDNQFLLDSLEGETDLHVFLARVIDIMDDAEENIDGIDIKMEKRRARKARFERRYEAMRELARQLMEQAGVRKVELPAATLSIRAGRPKVIITDETLLPPSCIRVKHEPDKPAIAECFARGEHVLGAEMSNAQEILTVRIK